MGFAAGDEDRPEQARRDDGFVYANLTAQTGQEMTMEAKMPEKWTQDGAWFSTHDGGRYYAGGQADAKVFVEAANGAIDQAFAVGLEAGKAQAATKPAEPRFAVGDRVLYKGKPDTVLAIDIDGPPVNGNEIWYGFSDSTWAHESSLAVAPAEPAPMVLTDAEKAVWGQVYAAALSVYETKELDNSHVLAMEAADAAITAIRARSAAGEVARLKPQNDGLLDHCIAIDKNAKQVQFELNQAQTRVAELETQLAAARQGAEINRAEGAKVERERCAGKIRQLIEASKAKRPSEPTALEHGINVGQQDALKTALDYILNPTT